MEKDNDMDAFIRDTLNSYQRIREKDRAPIQQTIVSRTSTNFGTGAPPLILASNNTSSGSVGGGGADIQFPFFISVVSGQNPKYKVSYNSSIIDGTNGGPFAINGLNTDKSISQERFIIAEADVQANPFKVSDSGFTIKEVGANETDEVVISTAGSFPLQTKLRLLIGKITVEDIPNGGGKRLTAWQAVTTSFRTAMSFHNGAAVFILQVAPTHQSRI